MSIENFVGNVEAFALAPSSEFSGATTDVRAVVGDKIGNLTFEKRVHGSVVFLPDVNISRFKKNPELLSQNIRIRRAEINVNSAVLSELENVSAALVFRNIDFRNPQILYEGSLCPADRCKLVSYDSARHIIDLNVRGFSSYSVGEGPFCGDSICQESCNVCVADCGVCPSGDSPGRGGSGGSGGSSGGCAPEWQCTWNACTNGLRTQTCIDKMHCPAAYGKPPVKKEVCISALSCVDRDGDGYGIGEGCSGLDANDDDSGTTASHLLNRTEIDTTGSSKKIEISRVLIGAIIGSIIIVGILLIVVSARHRRDL